MSWRPPDRHGRHSAVPADLIASDFSKLGLQPIKGLAGYFQPFEMTTSVDPDPEKSLLKIGNALALEKQFLPLVILRGKTDRSSRCFRGLWGESLFTTITATRT